ncbi:MAG: NitT/TauT family transport system substrate-binding protein [Paracoccaceae bacterium]|jgi:NitT/TauT family transport system substrate-binding protein
MILTSLARAIAAAAVLLATLPARADTPTITIAALKFGTVNWELDTIRAHGLDAANGFALVVKGMAGGPASNIVFQADEADAMVSDWIWVARQRAEGRDFVFLPYSKAVGALMVPADGARDISALKGGKIGIAGGPLDKSWLILRAWAEQTQGLDLAQDTEQVYGAPPLIYHNAVAGRLDGAINYWHFSAKMQAKGMRALVDVGDAARDLGLDPDTPLLGYVFKGAFVHAHPEAIAGFTRASRAAKDLLLHDDAEWDALRPRMKPADDAEFIALRDGWRAGVPAPGPVNEASAAAMLALMARLGGEALVGRATALPDGVFLSGL